MDTPASTLGQPIVNAVQKSSHSLSCMSHAGKAAWDQTEEV